MLCWAKHTCLIDFCWRNDWRYRLISLWPLTNAEQLTRKQITFLVLPFLPSNRLFHCLTLHHHLSRILTFVFQTFCTRPIPGASEGSCFPCPRTAGGTTITCPRAAVRAACFPFLGAADVLSETIDNGSKWLLVVGVKGGNMRVVIRE